MVCINKISFLTIVLLIIFLFLLAIFLFLFNNFTNIFIVNFDDVDGFDDFCPEGYVRVPADNYFSYEDFCVMKYEAKAFDTKSNEIIFDGCGNLTDLKSCNYDGVGNWADLSFIKPISVSKASPWRQISFEDAFKACNNLGEGYQLITNRQWMTIARNIESVSNNWSLNKVGGGTLAKGLHKSENIQTDLYKQLAHPPPNAFDECKFAYVDEYNIVCQEEGDFIYKRTLELSNNEIIWDFAGSVWEWVDAKEDGSVVDGDVCGNDGWNHFPNCNIENEKYSFVDGKDKRFEIGPKFGYNSSHGIGMIYSSQRVDRVFKRGGSWVNLPASGIFSLDLRTSFDVATSARGFRCTFVPN